MAEPDDLRGLPDPTTARSEGLARLRETVAVAGDHARNEALGDLAYALTNIGEQVKAIQAFDRSLLELLLPDERDEAWRFLRDRNQTGLSCDEAVPF